MVCAHWVESPLFENAGRLCAGFFNGGVSSIIRGCEAVGTLCLEGSQWYQFSAKEGYWVCAAENVSVRRLGAAGFARNKTRYMQALSLASAVAAAMVSPNREAGHGLQEPVA